MIKAMIVDDEPAVATIISHFIEKENIPIEIVACAYDGAEALEMMTIYNPRLVFVDIQMPFINGLEVMQRDPDYLYIVITAFESFSYAQQALRLGAKDIILKPIEYKQLAQAISRAIGWQFTNNELVNEILEYINDYYYQKIELSYLASVHYSSSSHIARLFKKHMNISVISYIHKVRVGNAVNYFENSDYSIKEVADLVGYESLNNFYKYFKIYTKLTPAQYIKKKQIKNV